jgi:hypothetical protein
LENKPAKDQIDLEKEHFNLEFRFAMGYLNNIPIAYTVKSDADFHYQPLTPSHFLMGSAYNELQPKDGEAGLLSKAIRYNRVCKLLDVF